MRLVLLAVLALFSIAVFAQEEKEMFVIQKEIKHLPVISQGSTGTCWSFATTSFLESEIIRQGLPETDLSEMYFVNYCYKNKIEKYLMYHGNNNFGQGSLAHDVIDIIRENGMATQDAFPGKMVDGKYSHGELANTLSEELKEINKKRRGNFDFTETEELNAILEEHIGEVPTEVNYQGEKTEATELSSLLKINPDDYIEISSFSHHAYYKQFVLEVPDNWAHSLYYNVPIEELMEVMFYAVNNNYSISWDGDVSEKLFQHKNGKADVPAEQIGNVTQELRQETFLNRTTTDDHLMHIVGLSNDSKGRTCFYTKNSWGPDSNQHGGYLHMTEDYVKLKTVGIMIHKDAIPKNIKRKLKL